MKSEGLRKFMLLGLLVLCSCNAELHSSGFGTMEIGPNQAAWKQNLGRGRVLSYEKGDLNEKGILKLDAKVIRHTQSEGTQQVRYEYTNEEVEIYVDGELAYKSRAKD